MTSGPTTGGSGPCSRPCRRTSRCSPPPPPPTPGSPRTWPSSCRVASADESADGRACSCCAGRSTGSRCGWRWCGCPPRRCGWPGSPSNWRSGALPNSGIIYTLTVAAAYETAAFLREQGIAVTAYSGKDDQAQRLAAEDDLLDNRVKALVATSALGMGFDKPDLGFVVHLGAPQSPVAYYQQIGRAGRGVERADVVLLPGREDRDIWAYFASLAFPPERQVRATLEALADAGRPLSTAALETHVDLSRGRLETMLKVLDVDGAVTRTAGGWAATGLPWSYDGERYERVAARAVTRAAGDARLPGDRRVPDGVPAPRARRPRGGPVRAVRQLHRPALVRRRGAGRRGGRAGPARPARRLGRAAEDVADRHEGTGDRRRLGQDRRLPAGRAGPGARPADRRGLGRPRCAPARRGRTGRRRSPTQLTDAVVKVLAALGLVFAAGFRGDDAVPDAAGARGAASASGSPPSGGSPTSGRSATPRPTGPGPRRHNSAQRLASLWRALVVPDDAPRRARPRRTARCCSSTTRSTPAGR